MFSAPGLVGISLGWVVLDRPDQSGLYIAKDLVGGWAYLIADDDGDTRFRGQGACAGGIDVALRCALLSAVACVPDSQQMRVVVDSRLAHRLVVGLVVHDRRVNAAIGGRQVSVMTRPLERSIGQVQTAAERAASTALRERERDEWRAAVTEDTTEIREILSVEPSSGDAIGWRQRQPNYSNTSPQQSKVDQTVRQARSNGNAVQPATGTPARPPLSGIRASTAATCPPGSDPARPRGSLFGAWLRDIDKQVESLRTDLQGAGA